MSETPPKMKVSELKEELAKRNIEIPKSAKKATLVTLLQKAMEGEENSSEIPEIDETHVESVVDDSEVVSDVVETPNPLPDVGEPVESNAESTLANSESDSAENKIDPEPQQPINETTEPIAAEEKVTKSEKRKRSVGDDSDTEQVKRSKSPDDEPIVINENYDFPSMVRLDKYGGDLSFYVSEDGLRGKPETESGFASYWSGTRCTHGIRQPDKANQHVSCAFEVKLLEVVQPNLMHHAIRIGWSRGDNNNLQIGDEVDTWAYESSGKKCSSSVFEEYGAVANFGDVIGAYISSDANGASEMSFSKNGVDMGVAFKIEPNTFNNISYFPAILCKNVSVEVNFGETSEPLSKLKDGYFFINSFSERQLERAPLPPASRSESECIMMIGLPACGKTTYAEKLRIDNPEKRYVILGTQHILSRMSIDGVPRKKTQRAIGERSMSEETLCLNTLIELASRRNRNYILDQSNVFENAQKRKMANFKHFRRIAVVIVPKDEEYMDRRSKRANEQGAREIIETGLYEMKANFVLPKPDGILFDEVREPELTGEDLIEKVKEYVDEAIKRGHRPGENRHRGSRGRGGRSFRHRPGSYRGQYRQPFNQHRGYRGGPPNRNMGRPPYGPRGSWYQQGGPPPRNQHWNNYGYGQQQQQQQQQQPYQNQYRYSHPQNAQTYNYFYGQHQQQQQQHQQQQQQQPPNPNSYYNYQQYSGSWTQQGWAQTPQG